MNRVYLVRHGENTANLTTGDTYRLNNNAVRMRSPELAKMYADEFELMFTQHKFGPSRPKNKVNPPVTVGGMKVQLLFAPEDGVAAKLSERISQAQSQVRFLAFSFTHDGMGVTAGEFDALVEDLVTTLDGFEVPKAEQDELLGLLGPMRADIVEVESSETGTPLPETYQAAPALT